MLRRLSLRDVVIVSRLELEFGPGFTVLTGETGAGKSILVDALQLALGSRAEAVLVREGAARAEVSAEFDLPATLLGWLDESGFVAEDGLLLVRRTVDAQGRSRAWINGSAATVAQLRELADHLVDIHGQHAWQGLTRPAAVRALLDGYAGLDTRPLAAAWQHRQQAAAALADARAQHDTRERERERLAWQVAELDKLAPGRDEWDELNAAHRRLAHGQALLDGARAALDAASEGDAAAGAALARAVAALAEVERYDTALGAVLEVLRGAQAQLGDAAHTLQAYLGRSEPDPERLNELDARLSAWVSLARRWRRPPAELPALLDGWRRELAALESAADLDALERAAAAADAAWREQARRAGAVREQAAPRLARAVTEAMQPLGMAGGRFEVALLPQPEPQSWGLENVELRVAGHAGSTPRALAKVASGGELSRLALAVAVTTCSSDGGAVPTLIFDEIDAGVGGAVGDRVGELMRRLGRAVQVLAVTHLPQVAAAADHHVVVAKATRGGTTTSEVRPLAAGERAAEIARMLGGEAASGTAHAQALLARATAAEAGDEVAQ